MADFSGIINCIELIENMSNAASNIATVFHDIPKMIGSGIEFYQKSKKEADSQIQATMIRCQPANQKEYIIPGKDFIMIDVSREIQRKYEEDRKILGLWHTKFIIKNFSIYGRVCYSNGFPLTEHIIPKMNNLLPYQPGNDLKKLPAPQKNQP